MAPFKFESYRSPYSGSIADLLSRSGDAPAAAILGAANANAQAAQARGNAWGGALQNIGQAVAQIPQQMQQQKVQAQSQEMNALALTDARRKESDIQAVDSAASLAGPDRQKFINALPGHMRMSALKSFTDADSAAAKAQEAIMKVEQAQNEYGATLGSVIAEHDYDPTAAQLALAHAKQTFQNNPQMLQRIGQIEADIKSDPTKTQAIADGLIALSPERLKIVATAERDKATSARQARQDAEVARHNAAQEAIAKLTEGRQEAQQKETNRHNLAVEEIGRKRAAASGTNDDAIAIADAIEDGLQPPTTQGLYRFGAPVKAELSRRGFDLTGANLDWEATKKHLSTLNGAQQTRLRQAIETAGDSLGVIEDLAKQWDGGRFPLLNKATLIAAKNGTLGKDAQKIATNLVAQITDVTSELGNVYMGGNSPTDHALKLAGQNLSADWTKEQLLGAIELARTNLKIRRNSIVNSGAITTKPEPPKIDGGVFDRDANGKIIRK